MGRGVVQTRVDQVLVRHARLGLGRAEPLATSVARGITRRLRVVVLGTLDPGTRGRVPLHIAHWRIDRDLVRRVEGRVEQALHLNVDGAVRRSLAIHIGPAAATRATPIAVETRRDGLFDTGHVAIRFASDKTCRQRSLQVVFAPSIVKSTSGKFLSQYSSMPEKMKSGLALFSVMQFLECLIL